MSAKFSLSPDPSSWGAPVNMDFTENDDFLHNPDPRRDRRIDKGGTIFTVRGLANLGCLVRSIIYNDPVFYLNLRTSLLSVQDC